MNKMGKDLEDDDCGAFEVTTLAFDWKLKKTTYN